MNVCCLLNCQIYISSCHCDLTDAKYAMIIWIAFEILSTRFSAGSDYDTATEGWIGRCVATGNSDWITLNRFTAVLARFYINILWKNDVQSDFIDGPHIDYVHCTKISGLRRIDSDFIFVPAKFVRHVKLTNGKTYAAD